jgi:hypothetical protein
VAKPVDAGRAGRNTGRMTPTLVLVHSPSVGPGTWQPVATCLRGRGVESVIPDLRSIGNGAPPYWPRVAQAVVDDIGTLDAGVSLLLVVHSNAGLFVPAIQQAAPRPIDGAIFVDAGLPAPDGETPVAPAEFQARLRELADADGILPPWTDWWTPDDVAELLPDPAVRAAVVAEQPRLPLAYYQQALPAPPAWTSIPAAYLQFSAGYAAEAGRARQAGWPVAYLPGEHLHQVVDPVAVSDRILGLFDQLNDPAN